MKNNWRFNQDVIAQFYEFFLTLEDPDVTPESRVKVLNMLDAYAIQKGYPNYEQLRHKPLYTLLTEVRRIISKQKGEFIAMSTLLLEILNEERTLYGAILRNDIRSKKGFTVHKMQKIGDYCKENINNDNDKLYVENIVNIMGYYLNDVILTGQG